MQRREGHFSVRDGTRLFWQSWTTADANSVVLIVHGISEHSECYHDVAARFVSQGFNVFAFDLRGHGRSPGGRGYIADFELFESDLADFIDTDIVPVNSPWWILGHSMGGLIVASYMLKNSSCSQSNLERLPPRGAILSAPALGLAIQVPWWKKTTAVWAARYFPKLTLSSNIDYRDLSRDPQQQASYSRDPLRHEFISPGIFLGMQEGFRQVFARAQQWSWPLLMLIPEDDKIVSSKAALNFFKAVPTAKKALFVYKDAAHELFHDLDKELVYADIFKFLADH